MPRFTNKMPSSVALTRLTLLEMANSYGYWALWMSARVTRELDDLIRRCSQPDRIISELSQKMEEK